MNSRDRYLLTQGYEQGFSNARFKAEEMDIIELDAKAEAEEWVDEVIADNGGTVGQFISHEAPKI